MKCLMDHNRPECEGREREVEFYTVVLGFAPERLDLYRAGMSVPSSGSIPTRSSTLFPESMWAARAARRRVADEPPALCLSVRREDHERLFRPDYQTGCRIRE